MCKIHQNYPKFECKWTISFVFQNLLASFFLIYDTSCLKDTFNDWMILPTEKNGSRLHILWKSSPIEGQIKKPLKEQGGTLLFQVQWWCYSEWVAGCNTAFYITLMLKHHWSQLKKKPIWTMKFNNNCLPSQKRPADLAQCNALALVALSCFCQTLAPTMKSLVKKREIVFGL